MSQNQKTTNGRNEYRCAIETNRNGKYAVRIQATFGRRAWSLKLYFLASSFDRAMKKLEDSLQFLQRHEERLWFWAAERGEDPKLAGEILQEVGLHLDRRNEFPRKNAVAQVTPDRSLAAFVTASLRRNLAESLTVTHAAAASN
jgi:hypothetical protein